MLHVGGFIQALLRVKIYGENGKESSQKYCIFTIKIQFFIPLKALKSITFASQK